MELPITSQEIKERFWNEMFIEIANKNAEKSYNALEEWLKNERIQNELMLSSVPCEYRANAMQRYREKETIYNEQVILKRREIEKIKEQESNPSKEFVHEYFAKKHRMIQAMDKIIAIELKEIQEMRKQAKIMKIVKALKRLNME